MTRARRVLCGLLFFLGGVQPGFAQAPGARDQSSDACPGTLASVRQACGCEPREEAAFNVLAQTKLSSDNLRSHVMNCFRLDGTLNVSRLKLSGDAALTGCLSKVEDQYPEYRQTLAELVKASKDVPPRKLDIWLGCYEKALGQGGRKPGGNPPKSSRAAASRSSTDAPATTTARQAGSSPSTAGAPAVAPNPDIEQRVEADGSGSVTTEGVEAVHDGKSGSGTIRQVIKASDKGVVNTGPIKAHVGP